MAVVFDDHTDAAPRRPTRTLPGPSRRTPVARRDAPGTSKPEPLGEQIPDRPLRSLRPRRAEARAAEAVPAAPPRPHRVAPMRTRTHGGADRDRRGVVRTTVWPRSDRPMVRLTAGVQAGPPLPLVVVPVAAAPPG